MDMTDTSKDSDTLKQSLIFKNNQWQNGSQPHSGFLNWMPGVKINIPRMFLGQL